MTKFVTGIGGIFFRSKDSKKSAAWYEEHFGIPATGSQNLWKQDEGVTVFAPFKEDTDYFGRKEQQFMINFRVTDMDKFLAKLEKAGVKIDPKRMNESYGKFAWVYDPDGNKIELWESTDETELTK